MKDDEQFTQDALSRLTPIEPSAELRRMVAQIPIQHPREVHSLWPFANLWMPSLSMAAVALFGLFVGRALSEDARDTLAQDSGSADVGVDENGELGPNEAASTPETVTGNSLDENDAELDELLVLATAGDFAADDWDLSQTQDDEPQEGTF